MKLLQVLLERIKQASKTIFGRDLIVTFVATFLGAYLALWTTKYQQEIQGKNTCKAELNLVLSELSAARNTFQLIIQRLDRNLKQEPAHMLLPFQIRLSNNVMTMATQSGWLSQYATVKVLSDVLTFSLSIDTFNRDLTVLNDYIYSVQGSEKKFDEDYFSELTRQVKEGAKQLSKEAGVLTKEVQVEIEILNSSSGM